MGERYLAGKKWNQSAERWRWMTALVLMGRQLGQERRVLFAQGEAGGVRKAQILQ